MAVGTESTGRVFLAAFLALGLVGCGTAHVNVYKFANNEEYSLPTKVAVLPFTVAENISTEDISGDTQPHVIFRNVFFNHFSYLGYSDLPLEEVDRRLAAAGLTSTTPDEKPDIEKLRSVLNVDAVILGHLLAANNFTGGIHSETRIEAYLEMIDLRQGDVVWETEHMEMAYAGIATPAVVDIIKMQMENAKVQEAYYNTAESFAIKVVRQIPDPAKRRGKTVKLPFISRIETNIANGRALSPNDRIYVTLYGDPGLKASFDIGSWKTGIPMKEVSPGLYTGSYRLKGNDQMGQALIIGNLEAPDGLIGKKFYKGAMAVGEEARLKEIQK